LLSILYVCEIRTLHDSLNLLIHVFADLVVKVRCEMNVPALKSVFILSLSESAESATS
jgi:hypothetical protein